MDSRLILGGLLCLLFLTTACRALDDDDSEPSSFEGDRFEVVSKKPSRQQKACSKLANEFAAAQKEVIQWRANCQDEGDRIQVAKCKRKLRRLQNRAELRYLRCRYGGKRARHILKRRRCARAKDAWTGAKNQLRTCKKNDSSCKRKNGRRVRRRLKRMRRRCGIVSGRCGKVRRWYFRKVTRAIRACSSKSGCHRHVRSQKRKWYRRVRRACRYQKKRFPKCHRAKRAYYRKVNRHFRMCRAKKQRSERTVCFKAFRSARKSMSRVFRKACRREKRRLRQRRRQRRLNWRRRRRRNWHRCSRVRKWYFKRVRAELANCGTDRTCLSGLYRKQRSWKRRLYNACRNRMRRHAPKCWRAKRRFIRAVRKLYRACARKKAGQTRSNCYRSVREQRNGLRSVYRAACKKHRSRRPADLEKEMSRTERGKMYAERCKETVTRRGRLFWCGKHRRFLRQEADRKWRKERRDACKATKKTTERALCWKKFRADYRTRRDAYQKAQDVSRCVSRGYRRSYCTRKADRKLKRQANKRTLAAKQKQCRSLRDASDKTQASKCWEEFTVLEPQLTYVPWKETYRNKCEALKEKSRARIDCFVAFRIAKRARRNKRRVRDYRAWCVRKKGSKCNKRAAKLQARLARALAFFSKKLECAKADKSKRAACWRAYRAMRVRYQLTSIRAKFARRKRRCESYKGQKKVTCLSHYRVALGRDETRRRVAAFFRRCRRKVGTKARRSCRRSLQRYRRAARRALILQYRRERCVRVYGSEKRKLCFDAYKRVRARMFARWNQRRASRSSRKRRIGRSWIARRMAIYKHICTSKKTKPASRRAYFCKHYRLLRSFAKKRAHWARVFKRHHRACLRRWNRSAKASCRRALYARRKWIGVRHDYVRKRRLHVYKVRCTHGRRRLRPLNCERYKSYKRHMKRLSRRRARRRHVRNLRRTCRANRRSSACFKLRTIAKERRQRRRARYRRLNDRLAAAFEALQNAKEDAKARRRATALYHFILAHVRRMQANRVYRRAIRKLRRKCRSTKKRRACRNYKRKKAAWRRVKKKHWERVRSSLYRHKCRSTKDRVTRAYWCARSRAYRRNLRLRTVRYKSRARVRMTRRSMKGWARRCKQGKSIAFKRCRSVRDDTKRKRCQIRIQRALCAKSAAVRLAYRAQVYRHQCQHNSNPKRRRLWCARYKALLHRLRSRKRVSRRKRKKMHKVNCPTARKALLAKIAAYRKACRAAFGSKCRPHVIAYTDRQYRLFRRGCKRESRARRHRHHKMLVSYRRLLSMRSRLLAQRKRCVRAVRIAQTACRSLSGKSRRSCYRKNTRKACNPYSRLRKRYILRVYLYRCKHAKTSKGRRSWCSHYRRFRKGIRRTRKRMSWKKNCSVSFKQAWLKCKKHRFNYTARKVCAKRIVRRSCGSRRRRRNGRRRKRFRSARSLFRARCRYAHSRRGRKYWCAKYRQLTGLSRALAAIHRRHRRTKRQLRVARRKHRAAKRKLRALAGKKQRAQNAARNAAKNAAKKHMSIVARLRARLRRLRSKLQHVRRMRRRSLRQGKKSFTKCQKALQARQAATRAVTHKSTICAGRSKQKRCEAWIDAKASAAARRVSGACPSPCLKVDEAFKKASQAWKARSKICAGHGSSCVSWLRKQVRAAKQEVIARCWA